MTMAGDRQHEGRGTRREARIGHASELEPRVSRLAPVSLPTTPEDHLVAWFAALAVTVHVIEAALPSPLPGVKPGLANVITLVLLARFGFSLAAWVALLRVLVGSLLLGTFLSPTFVLSLSGAFGSLAALWAASRTQHFGPIGHGLLAAQAHMAAQFGVAWVLFVPHTALAHLLPPLMTVAVATGLASGIIARHVLRATEDRGCDSPT